ncbi:MAG: hypothetical protein L0287_21060 [Anaerolineae bacterium]|nr:hypothetical protein [Anaerolineae bacterium]
MNLTRSNNSVLRYLGLALVAGSLLSIEVTLTRMFSIMIWYHFAYLIIGIALLGGGAAGTYLAVQQWKVEKISRRLGNLTLLLSLSVLLTLLIVNIFKFDPLDSSSSMVFNLLGLVSYFSGIFLIYFLGGLVVAGIFRCWSEDSHQLYFADLAVAVDHINYGGEPVQKHYDFLQTEEPDYLLIGEFSKWTEVYALTTLQNGYVLVCSVGEYDLYKLRN